MTWWYWVVLGLGLAAIELATPGGFFVIFFGLSAMLVGVLDFFGMAGPDWMQWLIFTVMAVVALFAFREPLLRWMRSHERPDTVDSLIGELAIAASAIAPDGHGKAELRGTGWNAHNVGTRMIAPGQRCRVVAVNGLVLELRAE